MYYFLYYQVNKNNISIFVNIKKINMKVYQFKESELLELIKDVNSFEKGTFVDLTLQQAIDKINSKLTDGAYKIIK